MLNAKQKDKMLAIKSLANGFTTKNPESENKRRIINILTEKEKGLSGICKEVEAKNEAIELIKTKQ